MPCTPATRTEQRTRLPLVHRARRIEFLTERGFGHTVKSACFGCPFYGNAGWRWIRDNDPDGWTDAVDFDRAIRHGYPKATEQGWRPGRLLTMVLPVRRTGHRHHTEHRTRAP